MDLPVKWKKTYINAELPHYVMFNKIDMLCDASFTVWAVNHQSYKLQCSRSLSCWLTSWTSPNSSQHSYSLPSLPNNHKDPRRQRNNHLTEQTLSLLILWLYKLGMLSGMILFPDHLLSPCSATNTQLIMLVLVFSCSHHLAIQSCLISTLKNFW